jgi:hypothetical protein
MPLAVIITAVVSLGVLSCSSDSGGGDPQTGLAHALASVPSTPASRAYFEYGSPAALRHLGVIHPAAVEHDGRLVDPKWIRVTGVGTGSLNTVSLRLADALALNVFAADSAISIGEPPNTATEINGSLDASAIKAKLREFGAKPRRFGDVDGLSFGPDNSVDLKRDLTSELQVTNQLDQVTVTDQRFAASPNSATLQQILDDHGTALIDTDSYQGMSDCLGDVLAAIITTHGDSRASMIGIGVRTPASTTATRHEVVCLVPRPGAAVMSSARNKVIPDDLGHKADSRLSADLAHAGVNAEGKFVQIDLTMKPGGLPGLVINLLFDRTIQYWDGSCSRDPRLPRIC